MAGQDEFGGTRARAGLSEALIVRETLALIDEQGIAAASMRAVGERLDVRAMSLYRYVPSREVLLDLVVELVVDELDSDSELTGRSSSDWRAYLSRLAHGVRRFALAHPHAFPLVATRPPSAPWINPPLRSLRWIEAMIEALLGWGFTDSQVLFVYRSFNGFLLGSLLLETSAMALRDPKPGDGSFQAAGRDSHTDPVDASDPVPAALSPTRQERHRRDLDAAVTPTDKLDPADEVDLQNYPEVFRLRAGLTEDHYATEFETGLGELLDRVDRVCAAG